jgi:hypothetical protein
VTNPFAQNVPAQEASAQPNNPFAGAQQRPPAQTYPPQQPAQAYAPQQPQAYVPPTQSPYSNPYGVAPGAQNSPAVYGGPQQQPQAYTPMPQGAPPALDPSMINAAPPPPPSADGKGAKLENMYGRLVLFFPHSRESKPKNPGFITDQDRASGNLMQDQVTATIVVIDDGRGGYSPVQWGGDLTRNQPHTDTAQLPYIRRGMWISQTKLIAQLTPFLPQGPGAAPGLVIGRPVKSGPERNSPWYLQAPTEADTAAARNYLDLVRTGQVPHPLAAA